MSYPPLGETGSGPSKALGPLMDGDDPEATGAANEEDEVEEELGQVK